MKLYTSMLLIIYGRILDSLKFVVLLVCRILLQAKTHFMKIIRNIHVNFRSALNLLTSLI